MVPLRKLSFLLPLLSATLPAQVFPWYQSPVTGRLYTLTPSMTWQQAEAHAASLGGQLASVRSQEQVDWLFAQFGVQQLWIGIHDVDEDGRFVRSSGDPSGFTAWDAGQPSAAPGADYVLSMGATWTNVPGGLLRPGVVELTDLAAYTAFGTGCASTAGLPILAAAPGSLPRLGETFTAQLSNLPTSPEAGNAFVLFGFSKTMFGGIPLPADLTPFGITGCTGYVSADAAFLVSPAGSMAEWPLNIPNLVQFLGLTFYNQALVEESGINPFGAVITNAAEATIGAEDLYPTGFGPQVGFPGTWVYIERTSTHAILAQRQGTQVLAVDFATGDRAMVSDDGANGSGAPVVTLVGLAVDGDQAYVMNADAVPQSLIEIDLLTGQRTIIANDVIGTGPWVGGNQVTDLVVDGGRILVALVEFNPGNAGVILAVDRVTGDRTIISDSVIGAGPAMTLPIDMALDGSRVLVVDSLDETVIAVDLASGDRTIISDDVTGTGPPLVAAYGIVLDGSRALVATNVGGGTGSVMTVDLATGNRAVLSDDVNGLGPVFQNARDIIVDGDRALVSDGDRVIVVDLITGDRTVISM